MTASTDLSELEQGLWSRLSMALAVLPAALDEGLKRESSLTHFEFSLLSALGNAPRRALLMSDVARHAHCSLSRLSHAVTRLESEGLVTREACETDRRATWAVLTPAGSRSVEAATPIYHALVRELVLDRLDVEQVRGLGLALEAIFPSECASIGDESVSEAPPHAV